MSIASLSLLRQIGMTIAPTIYAGFIARGFSNMGDLFKTDFQDVLQENIAQANLSQDALGELAQIGQQMASGSGTFDSNQINEIVGSIQDPALKEVILNSVSEITKRAAEIGYGGLYWSAAILGVLIILASLLLIPLREKVRAPGAE
ncbi:hypothetical protein D3C76_1243700 [compost metagenome]